MVLTDFGITYFGLSQKSICNTINSGMEEQTINLMFPNKATHWTLYVDPATSLILTALILYTTLGLLRGKHIHLLIVRRSNFDPKCSKNSIRNLVPVMILLQTVPRSIDLNKLEKELIDVTKKEHQVKC